MQKITDVAPASHTLQSETAHAFDLAHVIHELKHYLPAQAPLKDFIHHNTLHAFQTQKFYDGLRNAADIFGYKISLSLDEYRAMYRQGLIHKEVMRGAVAARYGAENVDLWIKKMLDLQQNEFPQPRVGRMRRFWKTHYQLDMDGAVQPILFRLLCSYLDQGIALWDFPVQGAGFVASVRELERNTFSSFFRSKRARQILKSGEQEILPLLKILVGHDTKYYENYLFDQQFSHQGWSGLVSTVENQPETLLNTKQISLQELIYLELLFEIDALDAQHGTKWKPLENVLVDFNADLFREEAPGELSQVLALWQDVFEWNYYDRILGAIQYGDKPAEGERGNKKFQALFCIDDRECSFRRYLEHAEPGCETFGTPGFFSVEFYFQPEGGKFVTKLCPAPVTPKYLIKEIGSTSKRKKDVHLSKNSHSLMRGWLISQTLGFWSATRLVWNIFRPSMSPATASSFLHHDKVSRLTIENTNLEHIEHGLQVGFTVQEMATRVENLLRSIGLVEYFAPLVYLVGHGSSSVNNPHYAAYDCGACCGRPGSVNARVLCHMANHVGVREILATRGIVIPASTQFVGALHDTTRDEIAFYDEDALTPQNLALHHAHEKSFDAALDANAKERSRRLELIDTHLTPAAVHKKIKLRSVSLFEPRPELNHATNSLCIVGRRVLTQKLFLDRRSFLNSYDYRVDPEGKALFGILKAAAPVCGGINLEYFFSRVDNQKLGAGSKLPHNVMGLFGVANGADGDLRPGLPSQMIEVHDPVRLLIVVEHFPEVVLKTIQSHPETYEWFENEWVHLAVYRPDNGKIMYFKDGAFTDYQPIQKQVETVADIVPLIESNVDNISIVQIQ